MDEERLADDVTHDAVDDLDRVLGRTELQQPGRCATGSCQLEMIAVQPDDEDLGLDGAVDVPAGGGAGHGLGPGVRVGSLVGASGAAATVRSTPVPTATMVPATGSLAMTWPTGTVDEGTASESVSLRPADDRATSASASDMPTTSGTVTSSRCVETVGMTVEPGTTDWPALGSWSTTVPSGPVGQTHHDGVAEGRGRRR